MEGVGRLQHLLERVCLRLHLVLLFFKKRPKLQCLGIPAARVTRRRCGTAQEASDDLSVIRSSAS